MQETLLMEKEELLEEEKENKKVLFVIAPTNFKDEEYYIPKKILEENGIKTKTASSRTEATSVAGKRQKIDILLSSAETDYDAIIFIGGIGASTFFKDKTAHNLINNFNKKNKIIAAICIAPVTLANAGILNGKKATVFPSGKNDLIRNGAKYTGDSVTVDGNIITANGPMAAEAFGKKIVEMLK